MSREICLIVRPKPHATHNEVELIRSAFDGHEPPFDRELDGRDVVVFLDALKQRERLEKALLHALAQHGLADKVLTPLWRTDPWLPPEEISWLVSLQPASAFRWNELREAVAAHGRVVIRETNDFLTVGAPDANDAQRLVDDLCSAGDALSGEVKPIGWFRRWQIREQLLGNYALGDTTQPF